jgi:hypothetical protein
MTCPYQEKDGPRERWSLDLSLSVGVSDNEQAEVISTKI